MLTEAFGLACLLSATMGQNLKVIPLFVLVLHAPDRTATDKLWNILQRFAIKTVNSKGNSLTLIAAIKVPSDTLKSFMFY